MNEFKIDGPPTRELVDRINLKAIAKLVLEIKAEDRPCFLETQLFMIRTFPDIHAKLTKLIREQLKWEAKKELSASQRLQEMVGRIDICEIYDFDASARSGRRRAGYCQQHRSSVRHSLRARTHLPGGP